MVAARRGRPRPEPLRAAAASDLQGVLPELAARFEARAEIPVACIFGASGQLARQIRQGAPFDLFLSADRMFVLQLADAGVVRPDSVRPYALGTLVLAVHRGGTAAVDGLADLTGPGVAKIAIANPEAAPYGRAAQQALERAGLWERVRPKLVLAETVRQALQFVRTGNAEVGLVGRSVADVPEVWVIPLDPDLYDPIVQALGVVAGRPREADARAFVRFLVGDEAQARLGRSGLRRPPAATAAAP